MGYDLGHDSATYVFTHARAFSIHPAFELVGAVDICSERRDAFTERYGKPSYELLETALDAHLPDVVVIAASTEMHAQLVESALHCQEVKVILSEKPLAYSLNDAKCMADACRMAGVALFVNYMRRVDSGVAEIKRMLEDGRIVGPIKGVAWYSKGFLHNGSHFFNLLEYWLGGFKSASIIQAGRMWDEHDPEPDVFVRFELGDIVFRSAWEEAYSHYTIELLSPSGRLRYEQGGAEITWQSTQSDPQASGYRVLSSAECIGNSMDRIQWHVADHLKKYFNGEPNTLCTGAQALETLQSMHHIINKTV